MLASCRATSQRRTCSPLTCRGGCRRNVVRRRNVAPAALTCRGGYRRNVVRRRNVAPARPPHVVQRHRKMIQRRRNVATWPPGGHHATWATSQGDFATSPCRSRLLGDMATLRGAPAASPPSPPPFPRRARRRGGDPRRRKVAPCRAPDDLRDVARPESPCRELQKQGPRGIMARLARSGLRALYTPSWSHPKHS